MQRLDKSVHDLHMLHLEMLELRRRLPTKVDSASMQIFWRNELARYAATHQSRKTDEDAPR